MQPKLEPLKHQPIDVPNDPMVLYVQAIEFDPNIHTERRKLTVDVEIQARDVQKLIEKFTERMKGPLAGTIRVRFIGRPV